MMDYRQTQINILDQNPDLVVGDVTTVNLTILQVFNIPFSFFHRFNIFVHYLYLLQGGVQINVVPPEFDATVDARVALNVDLDEFDALLRKWCEESGDGVEINFISKNEKVQPTKLDDSNPYWVALKKEMDDM